MRRKITFLLTFLVAVLSIALAGGRVYADTGYEVEDYANQEEERYSTVSEPSSVLLSHFRNK